jgi:hypothetical protein
MDEAWLSVALFVAGTFILIVSTLMLAVTFKRSLKLSIKGFGIDISIHTSDELIKDSQL